MPQFINFYENIAEARMRLEDTIVLYDGAPYFIYFVSDHKNDGKFRAYMDDYKGKDFIRHRKENFPRKGNFSTSDYGGVLDDWLQNHPNCGMIRKEIGSPKFDKFRPFLLGNMNINGSVIYVERTPTRNTNQGLKERSVYGLNVTPVPNPTSTTTRKKGGLALSYNNEAAVNIYGEEFYQMMAGYYPDLEAVLKAFQDPQIINTGVAFDREFSVFRGPLDMLILCYQSEGIGLLDNGDSSSVIIGSKYGFLRETIEELNCFSSVKVK